MGLNLKDALVSIPNSDVSGPRSSKRFAYQRSWALAELLEYHLAGKDYVFAFEFHDDVLILDSEDDPKLAQFVQVKTDTTGKKWSVTRLTNVRKSKKPEVKSLSIIGKLYENSEKFDSSETRLRFVSNAFFSFPVGPGGLNATSLDKNGRTKISTRITAELGLKEAIDLSLLHFEQSSLSVDEHVSHIKGKLHGFFENLLGEDHQISIGPWYRALSDEIQIKNDYEPDKVKSFEDLIRNKCITRSEIEKFLLRAENSKQTFSQLNDIKTKLSTEGVGFKEIQRIDRAWRKFNVDRLNYENRLLKDLEHVVATCLIKCSVEDDAPLKEIVASVMSELDTELYKYTALYDNTYITVAILWTYCEQ